LLHRWVSLVLGVVLLVITTSGAFLVYGPEWWQWTNSSAYAESSSHVSVSPPAALGIVNAAHPDLNADTVNVYGGVYEVSAVTHAGGTYYTVDPASGRILGEVDLDRGFMAFMKQAHDCFFSCSELPGYIAVANHSVPTLGMKWLTDLTWGQVLLGGFALLLIFLALSGLWLWWGTLKKWADAVRVRWHRGRYARDFDLHNVIGIAAVPFLLVWGLTGAMIEFPWAKSAWYATTGGSTPADSTLTSNPAPKGTPDLTPDAAITAAAATVVKRHGHPGRLTFFELPAADDPASTYTVVFHVDGFDPYSHHRFPGQENINVDRHDAGRVGVIDLSPGAAPTVSNALADSLALVTLHFGQTFNVWWRLLWFGFGMAPLLLALTGVSTWLAKRGVRKRRRQAAATPTGPAGPAAPPAAVG
jgi:uncharacterized iron-regulated membrane protein